MALHSGAHDTSGLGTLVGTCPLVATGLMFMTVPVTEDETQALRNLIPQIIADLKTEKARCDTVLAKDNSAITPGDTKDVARAAKRIADATIDLARFIKATV